MTTAYSLSMMILGDICPTDDTRAIFDNGTPEKLLGSLVEHIRNADISIANLEYVLSESARPIEKSGPVLVGNPGHAKFLQDCGFNILGLANNHIKDCGAEGVLDTLEACSRAGILTTGAGRTSADAAIPAVLDKAGWKIGIFAVAEHEFNAASDNEAGAHIFDPLDDLEKLHELRSICDYVIVLYHGGIEYHTYPSPLLQRTCRSLIRNGANLVLCQHSHTIGTFEAYEGGHILYGQGNSVYGYRANKPRWNEGLAVAVKLTRTESVSVEIKLIPIGCNKLGRVDLLDENIASACLAALEKRSLDAVNPKNILNYWNVFCSNLAMNQLPHLFGLGLWLTRINRIFRGSLIRILYRRRQRMVAMNITRCAAHREVTLTAIQQTLSQNHVKRLF